MHSDPRWESARNILCIRLDALGDVLMTSPAIRALRSAGAGRTITLLTSSAGAGLATFLDDVDQTLVYDPPWMKASPAFPNSAVDLQMIERLKRPNFDAAVIFTSFSQSPLPASMLAYLAEIPLRLAHCRENPYQLLTNWLPETDLEPDFGMRHEVRRQLDLVAAIGSTTADESIALSLPEVALTRARDLLREIHLDTSRPWIILHPGASAASRRYPLVSFAQAARDLARDHAVQVVFTGAGSEVDLVESIRARMEVDSFSLAGRLGVQEFAAAIALAPLLVSNNSGPVHIAAGVKTPVVDLYALTNPQHTPWMLPHRTLYHDVPCRFCLKSICPMGHHNCLRLVPPEVVVRAALELLEEIGA